jgi:N-acetylglucosaminyldiphosphoundecaprenol N-acetyl-beta-D-mannosaminyltransferase
VAGGLALAFSTVLAVGVLSPLEEPLEAQLKVVLVASSLVFFVCLSEDVGQRRWWPRLLALLVASGVVCAVGLTIHAVKIPLLPHRVQDLQAASFPVTILWLLAVSYAVASTDRMPGLTAGIGFLTALTLFIVALWKSRDAGPEAVAAACLAAVLVGSCGGCLRSGLAAQPLGLGHSGAAFLGFILAVVTVLGTLKTSAFLILILPVLALGVPVLNVTYARLRRVRGEGRGARDEGRGTGIQSPDNRKSQIANLKFQTGLHLHDMLLARGFSPQRTVILLLALQAYFCLVALALVGIIEVSYLVKSLLLLLLLPAGGAIFFLISRIAAQVAREIDPTGTVQILGVKVHTVTMDTALEQVRRFIREGGPHHLVTADTSCIMKAREDPALRDLINAADLVTPDGAGVLWTAKVLDLPLSERVSGVDLTDRMCALAAQEGYRVYFLGAAPGVAEKAARVLQEKYPGLPVAGARDGYFQPQEEDTVAEQIRAARAQMVFVALGIPKQEQWIQRHQERVGAAVYMGIGGSFDVISGNLPRAPLWMQRNGLEWLYRVLLEPRRIVRLTALPLFVLIVTWDRLKRMRDKG